MQINVFTDINNYDQFELAVGSVREALNGIKLHQGANYVRRIIETPHRFILLSNDPEIAPVALLPDVMLSPLPEYDTLLIVPEIGGEIGEAIAAAIGGVLTTTAVVGGVTVTTLTTLGMVVAAVINIAISIGLSALMQALSPTNEFTSDPAFAQHKQSSLFNGAPIIQEQGGSVPIVFGNPYCGGVLISSGISTVDA